MATHSIIAQLPVELLSTPVPVPGGGGGGQCIVDLAAAIALLGSSCGGGLELRIDGRAQAVDVHHEENMICVTPTPTIPDDGGDDDGGDDDGGDDDGGDNDSGDEICWVILP